VGALENASKNFASDQPGHLNQPSSGTARCFVTPNRRKVMKPDPREATDEHPDAQASITEEESSLNWKSVEGAQQEALRGETVAGKNIQTLA